MAMIVDNLQQGSAEWLIWRQEGITATDAAVITGRSEHKTRWQLWAEKLGFREPDDLSNNPYVIQGNLQEDSARQAAERFLAKKLGQLEILLPVCARSSSWHVLRASFDGIRVNDEPVELKCPADATFLKVRAEREESEAYKHYWPQVQHQLLVAEAKRGWLVFYRLNEDGDEETEVFEVQRNDLFLDDLTQAAREFHEHLVKRKEPQKDPEKDLFIPNQEQSIAWVARANAFKSLDAEVRVLDAQMKSLKEKQKTELDIMVNMMEQEGFFKADFAGVSVTRFNQVGRTDWKAMAEENLPDVDRLRSAYTGQSAMRCRVTTKADKMPKQIVMPEVRALLEGAEACQVETFF